MASTLCVGVLGGIVEGWGGGVRLDNPGTPALVLVGHGAPPLWLAPMHACAHVRGGRWERVRLQQMKWCNQCIWIMQLECAIEKGVETAGGECQSKS